MSCLLTYWQWFFLEHTFLTEKLGVRQYDLLRALVEPCFLLYSMIDVWYVGVIQCQCPLAFHDMISNHANASVLAQRRNQLVVWERVHHLGAVGTVCIGVDREQRRSVA